MTEAEFDCRLQRVLTEAIWQECLPCMEEAENAGICFSDRYLKRMEKMLQDPFTYAKKADRTPWQRVARSAAVFVATLSILFALAMSMPTVRAAVVEVYLEWYETHIAMHVQGIVPVEEHIRSEDVFVEIPTTVLPDGFEESSRSEYTGLIIFSNESGDAITLDYQGLGGSSILAINNEDVTIEKVKLNGKEYWLLEATGEETKNQIAWIDKENKLMFGLVAPNYVDVDTLLHLSEHVLVKPN